VNDADATAFAPVAGGRVTVDLDAMAANYASLCALALPAQCAAVVKANAYGLGLEPVARRLASAGCTAFFVANLSEGQALRALLTDVDIYVLEGPWPAQERVFVDARLRPVINRIEQFDQWAALPAPPPYALHVDTGMSRLGLTPDQARALAAKATGPMEPAWLMTHLACADEPDHELTSAQLALFDEFRALFPGVPASIGNTAGVEAGLATRGQMVRAGIGLYGSDPHPAARIQSRAVVTLEGRVLQVREVPDGTSVGYGARYRARGPARLATLGLGYADGYPRSLGNRGYAVVDSARVPVVGRVSMDSLVIDVTRLPKDSVRCGDLVELLGANAKLDELAALAGTISYELLTRLGERLERRYTGRV
jgi:alanine racemase